jgi:hypothetical protein
MNWWFLISMGVSLPLVLFFGHKADKNRRSYRSMPHNNDYKVSMEEFENYQLMAVTVFFYSLASYVVSVGL